MSAVIFQKLKNIEQKLTVAWLTLENSVDLTIHIFKKSFLKIILCKDCLLFSRNLAGLPGGQVKHQVRAPYSK